jgi:hypothetical protein
LPASWSIWVGIAVSTRARDPRTAKQLSILASLPIVAITTVTAFNLIPATPQIALVFDVGCSSSAASADASPQQCSTENGSSPTPNDQYRQEAAHRENEKPASSRNLGTGHSRSRVR